MLLHKTSGNWKLGFSLAILTMLLWATLPVALKVSLEQMDPYTLTWYRFLFAFIVLLIFYTKQGKLSKFRQLNKKQWLLLLAAGIMLVANYVLFLLALEKTTPANTQIIMQLAPILLALSGILLFKEKFNPIQWIGFSILVLGMAIFYYDQITQLLATFLNYYVGLILALVAAITWTVYAIIQKQLLIHLPAGMIMFAIYGIATVSLLPVSNPLAISQLDQLHALMLLYCAINTLGAYGALAESMAHWEASKISAIIAMTPIGVLLIMVTTDALFPGLVAPETISIIGWMGAVLVVIGSIMTSLGQNQLKNDA